MDIVDTPDGPLPALDPEAIKILAAESANPMIRRAARAWLDHYRLSRLIGMTDLEARLAAVAACASIADKVRVPQDRPE